MTKIGHSKRVQSINVTSYFDFQVFGHATFHLPQFFEEQCRAHGRDPPLNPAKGPWEPREGL